LISARNICRELAAESGGNKVKQANAPDYATKRWLGPSESPRQGLTAGLGGDGGQWDTAPWLLNTQDGAMT